MQWSVSLGNEYGQLEGCRDDVLVAAIDFNPSTIEGLTSCSKVSWELIFKRPLDYSS